ncbi:Porin [Granulibacter bethesdensis]|nr:Porin [Granulibacter bethesdensis]
MCLLMSFQRVRDRVRASSRLAVTLPPVALVCVLMAGSAMAQTSGTTRLPGSTLSDAPNPRVVPGLIKPIQTKEIRDDEGPLGPLSRTLLKRGISFHVSLFDFFSSNPSVGQDTGNTVNSTYLLTGADFDLDKILGIHHARLHFEETFFGLRANNIEATRQFSDSSTGYQTTYNLRSEQLSTLTYEQTFFNDRLNIELGRTHPNRFFALPTCQTLNSCYNNILYHNAGYISPLYSMWGGRVSYALTPTTYIEAGSFAAHPDANAHSGWDWGQEPNPGALTLVEIGHKTGYETQLYPGRYSLTGFYNSSSHPDNDTTAYGRSRGLNPGDPVRNQHGTQGIVINTEQVVWRADGGHPDADSLHPSKSNPTAISLYSGLGYSFDSTIPFQSDLFVGANLHAPFASRPYDRFGVKLRWVRMNGSFARYLSEANAEAGGSGAGFSRDKAIFEINAHVQMFSAIALEPVVQYVLNPDSYYNPYSARRPRDGWYAGAALIVPVGAILGLKPL